ncbi:MAG: hypothetical protein SNJ56_05240, partial [Termitinemataceae bacterium]
MLTHIVDLVPYHLSASLGVAIQTDIISNHRFNLHHVLLVSSLLCSSGATNQAKPFCFGSPR